MIRSLNSWHSPKPKYWADDQRRYRQYLKKIAPQLPPPLARLTEEFNLHDDMISNVQIISEVPSGRDALVTIEVFRDGFFGTAGLLVLHLIGLQGAVKKVASDLDIMFFDVEILRNSALRLSFALDNKKTWSVKFRDFGFYYYDYRSKGPFFEAVLPK